jgi:predicted AAA+ superfamily ATPase
MVTILGARAPFPRQCNSKWRTHQGAELDLLIVRGSQRLGFEFKRTSAPTVTKSMHIAVQDLHLDSLHVIHGGARSFPMADGIRAVAARSDFVRAQAISVTRGVAVMARLLHR